MEIKADKNKPYIFLDKKECELTIKGKSYPEHPVEFYRPIEEKLIKFMSKDKCKGLTINLSLEILNSVSSKLIYFVNVKSSLILLIFTKSPNFLCSINLFILIIYIILRYFSV